MAQRFNRLVTIRGAAAETARRLVRYPLGEYQADGAIGLQETGGWFLQNANSMLIDAPSTSGDLLVARTIVIHNILTPTDELPDLGLLLVLAYPDAKVFLVDLATDANRVEFDVDSARVSRLGIAQVVRFTSAAAVGAAFSLADGVDFAIEGVTPDRGM